MNPLITITKLEPLYKIKSTLKERYTTYEGVKVMYDIKYVNGITLRGETLYHKHPIDLRLITDHIENELKGLPQ